MVDENFTSPSPTTADAVSCGPNSPATNNASSSGFAFRRAATFAQPSQLRHRLNESNDTLSNLRRRSSTYSDFLETSADELLNPSKTTTEEDKKSPFVYIPLTLALLPAVAGVFFENGAAFFTDLILLSLAAVFLHWSVTQPWDWYHSAQQVRVIQDGILTDAIFEPDSDPESTSASVTTALEDIPDDKGKAKETETKVQNLSTGRNTRWEERQAAAVKELYLHELFALAWCFIFPMLGAYMLHTIRNQLSRPSEGLVSDYNLTIFICAAEVRPVSHLIRMVQKRTLHVQAVVAQNPHIQKPVTADQIKALYDRLDELEARGTLKESVRRTDGSPEVSETLVEAAVGREFRKRAQPELEALSRAMRRYEKRLTLLASQNDCRIENIEYRLNDAIAIAAIAAKNSNSQWTLVGWVIEKSAMMIMLPVQAATAVITFPFRTASTLFRWTGKTAPESTQRPLRNGKSLAQGKSGSDRVPTRMSRR
ncbi:hypothetical protein GGS21DRAFT_512139 [Xylaria nigripes]|nr:hypothetical protein GGS21DRAFT_512139 [Xylaria nigripes]